MNPTYAGRLCDDLSKCLRGSESNLTGLAQMLTVVLRDEAWRERRIRTGQVVTHSRFIDFIVTPPLEGLGEDPDRIKKLLRDDLAALAAFEMAIVGEKHKRKPVGDGNNITIKPERGTGRAYTLRRLSKDRPDLFTQVTAGKLSANKAAITAGFRRAPAALQQLQRWWKKTPAEDLSTFLEWVRTA